MTPTEKFFYARADFNAANDLVELLRLADAVPGIDHIELDPGAALRAAMRLAVDLKESARPRFEKAQEEFMKA
ncbi:hypothetical protein THIOKS1990010 [Thiocapsa sp. KS1]|nr:hypothetical protein [Thiocapsa sp. KS1]CRI68166.1 hypothetical protein THIOKS1990010 [Thiocapsa sp. KS1]